MPQRTTIFKQLIITVITPVIVIMVGVGFYNFYHEREEILNDRVLHINQVKQETRDFVDLFNQAILQFENEMSINAHKFSDTLVNHIFYNTNVIEKIDLNLIRDHIKMPDNYDIYIIDTNGIIVNTTYEKDLGLNFYDFGDFFKTHFKAVWDSGQFIEDPISIEMSTKLPKKYTYHSTIDKKYIIELGIYDEQSKNIVQLFTDKLNLIAHKYEDIDTISLFFGTDKFINYQGHTISETEKKQALESLSSKTEAVSVEKIDNIEYSTIFLYLDNEDTNIGDGYIVRIKYNNLKEQELIKAQLMKFGLLFFLIIIPMIVIIFWRARVISKPIAVLNKKVGEIQSGNLTARVPVSGNNEVTQLSEHFNSMMQKLFDSYNTLEDKVKERTNELEVKNIELADTHKEIQDSIMYAKRLQQAILPKLEDIIKNLPNSFIYFKPKDVVSGDFYWYEHHNDYDFIAAADCTGHGVPGALVSVVCNNALNRSIFELSKVAPENVLNSTRDLIINTLSKSEAGIKDGMDISLCRIDKKNKLIHFAGANNPLWIVRKTIHLTKEQLEERATVVDGEIALIEFKGNKQPVGLYENMTPFSSVEISSFPDDVLYLFTDGFADQFGGKRGKKFMYKPFKKTLLKISQLPMNEQRKELNTIFEDWKGDLEQVDDICIIGIRV